MRISDCSSDVCSSDLILLAGLTLSACNMMNRLANVGAEPQLSTIDSPAPLAAPQAVSLPMPAPHVIERQPNSLWRPGSRAFLKDQRASNVDRKSTRLNSSH